MDPSQVIVVVVLATLTVGMVGCMFRAAYLDGYAAGLGYAKGLLDAAHEQQAKLQRDIEALKTKMEARRGC